MSFESSAYIPPGTLDTTGRFTATTVQQHASLLAEIERLFKVAADALDRENAAKSDIERVKMELDHWRTRFTEARTAMAGMFTPRLVEALTDQRDEARRDRDRFAETIKFRVKELDEARAHVADARRIIEAVLRQCEEWDKYALMHPDARGMASYELREVMAAAGSGTRPTGDCGCTRHNSNHSHCYAGCDLSGCRMLGGSERDYE